jgi:hypothetical protein
MRRSPAGVDERTDGYGYHPGPPAITAHDNMTCMRARMVGSYPTMRSASAADRLDGPARRSDRVAEARRACRTTTMKNHTPPNSSRFRSKARTSDETSSEETAAEL